MAYYNPQNHFLGITNLKRKTYSANKISSKTIPGFPLASIVACRKSAKPFVELTQKEQREFEIKTHQKFIKDLRSWLKKQNPSMIY